ncbi:Asp23/Gls24 family envelope stress response protein, partial [Jatrophihabitans sp.]|uniref:Asp23/Gls24 family envelope stress response protein n=1 Tax=Jatrophihabitans sp. TaxID=1932789 RepID=UPI002EE623A9
TATAVTENPAGPPRPNPDGPAAGRNEMGTISISESVVAKLAAQAAVEIPDAGAAAPRLLGRSLSGAGGLGVRATSLTGLPKASAHVDGSIALIRLEISVRWPASVPAVTAAVREHVRSRLAELTGLHVPEVTIQVTDLATTLAQPARRVR